MQQIPLLAPIGETPAKWNFMVLDSNRGQIQVHPFALLQQVTREIVFMQPLYDNNDSAVLLSPCH